MNRLFDLTGTLVGVTGIVLCLVAVLARIGGQHYLLGTEARMWLLGGIALVAIGSFAKLHALSKPR